MTFGSPDPYFLAEIFSESCGKILIKCNFFMTTQLWHDRQYSARKLKNQVELVSVTLYAILLKAILEQMNEVLKTAILPIRCLVFSGCGRGLPSCQVC